MKQLPIGTKVFAAGVTGISWRIQEKSVDYSILTLRSIPNETDHKIPIWELRQLIHEKTVSVELPQR